MNTPLLSYEQVTETIEKYFTSVKKFKLDGYVHPVDKCNCCGGTDVRRRIDGAVVCSWCRAVKTVPQDPGVDRLKKFQSSLRYELYFARARLEETWLTRIESSNS